MIFRDLIKDEFYIDYDPSFVSKMPKYIVRLKQSNNCFILFIAAFVRAGSKRWNSFLTFFRANLSNDFDSFILEAFTIWQVYPGRLTLQEDIEHYLKHIS